MSDEPKKTAEKPRASAYEKALSLVARREYSASELLGKLAQRGFEAEESRDALARLQAQNYQNDERFGGCLVRQRINDGYGPRWIIAELRTHGIAESSALEHIDRSEPDWDTVAAAQLRRRYGGRGASTPAERSKRGQFLLRRGFEVATVRSLTRADAVDGMVEFD